MRTFIQAKVHSTGVANDPKDLEKGLGYFCIVESTKRINDMLVPEYIKCKSKIALEVGEQLLEVEVFNIGGPNGGKVQTYYRIIRKAELGGKK